MSATAAKKKNQTPPTPPTTARAAALYIALGLFLLTLGTAWIITMLITPDSVVLKNLLSVLLGLCGPLCPTMPALLIWGGAKLMVSSRHRVSARHFFLALGIYWLVLAEYTLVSPAPSTGGVTISYLDYIIQLARSGGYASNQEFSAVLRHAYMQHTVGGGLLGMLIAYPLSIPLTRIGAALIVGVAILGLLALLFHLHPTSWFTSASALGEKRRARHAQRRMEKQQRAAENVPEEAPIPSQNMEQPAPVPPNYYRPAPIYQAPPAAQPTQQDQPGFYPVQPDLYEERFPIPENTPRQPMEEPAWRRQEQPKPVQPVQQPAAPAPAKPGKLSGLLGRILSPEAERQEPAPQEEAPKTAPAPAQKPVQKPVQKPALQPQPMMAQALDDEDDLPWETPGHEALSPAENASPIAPQPMDEWPTEQPAVRETRVVQAVKPEKQNAPRAAAKQSPKPAPAPAPAPQKPAPAPANSWAAQVSQKKAELDLPVHTTQKNEPQQVFTDPVMPITNERIPISPRQEKKEEAGARLDNTPAPKTRQMTMQDAMPYEAPPLRLLKEARIVPQADAAQEDEHRAQIIEGTLRSFGVESQVMQIMHGPSITRFAIQIAPGVKVSKVSNTADNLALELKTKHVRVEAPIQGTNYIGIEVPNKLVSTVSLREVLDSPEMKSNSSPLLVALGKDIAGAPVLCDLSKMPHLLIAGATGSGKSVCINSIVCSLLYRTTPDQVKLIMVDPKQVELSVYNTIPHLLVPVVSDPKKAAGALAWVVEEMLSRYSKFTTQGVRNLAGYNKANQGTDKTLPNIVVIIDEMADLMEVCRKDVEDSIRRLAALARAAGIYMVLATQRPSVDVITGVIKNNIPSRIAFAVSSGTDSRTIIDINGAEKLMGKGDMLYKPTGATPIRVQGCFVSDEEVNAIAEYIGSRYQTDFDPNIVDHLENSDNDRGADEITGSGGDADSGASGGEGSFQELLQQAIEMAVEDGQTSTSMLQRRLRVGYARAGRLIDEMEKRNIISQSEGSKPRKTLITREQYYEMMEES